MAVNLSDFYNKVSRGVDTKGTKINVAETKRVIASFFTELSKLKIEEAMAIQSKGIAIARKKAASARVKKKAAKK